MRVEPIPPDVGNATNQPTGAQSRQRQEVQEIRIAYIVLRVLTVA